MSKLQGESENPVDRLERIRELTGVLLLEGKSGMRGTSPGRPVSRDVRYILPGESIGEGGTFFMVGCSSSDLGMFVSMRQYSDFDTLADLQDPVDSDGMLVASEASIIPNFLKGAQPEGEVTLVSFFDTDKEYLSGFPYANSDYFENLEPIRTIDTTATDEELDRLIEVIQHPDLFEAVLGRGRLTYTFTMTNHLSATNKAKHDALIRVAEGHPEMTRFADRFFLGLGKVEGRSTPQAKQEHALPVVLRWLKQKLRKNGN